MKPSRKKRQVEDESMEEDDGAPISINALAKLTNSEVIKQVKAGMSHIAPLEPDDSAEDLPY